MRVVFIFHSSFLVELEKSVLIFDYYGEGRLPKLSKDKDIYFLNSHGHGDHFNRNIWELQKKYPKAFYVMSRDIRVRKEEREDWMYFVRAREEYQIKKLRVHTLRSTDMGVAFVVETEGKRIYHAGDLNWWHWKGEDKAWNNNIAANYQREVDKLIGQVFDLAFVPLDPRLLRAYDWGMRYFTEKIETRHLFPMHCWEEYKVCQKVKKEPWMQRLLNVYHPLEVEGQEWELC